MIKELRLMNFSQNLKKGKRAARVAKGGLDLLQSVSRKNVVLSRN